MAFNVNDFISAYMEKDGYRPNLFEVSFSNFISPGTIFTAKAASIPSSTIGSAKTAYFGRTSKFAGNRSFSNWTATFIIDEKDFSLGSRAIRGQFETWMARINKHEENKRLSAAVTPITGSGYFSNIAVKIYGKAGGQISQYNIWYAFPISVSPINLDWGANDTIAEFTVTFAYQWWEKKSYSIVNISGNPAVIETNEIQL